MKKAEKYTEELTFLAESPQPHIPRGIRQSGGGKVGGGSGKTVRLTQNRPNALLSGGGGANSFPLLLPTASATAKRCKDDANVKWRRKRKSDSEASDPDLSVNSTALLLRFPLLTTQTLLRFFMYSYV